MLKKIILLFFILSFVSCGKAYIKDMDSQNEADPKEFGLLVFSLTFLENGIQELPLFLTLTGEQGGSEEIRLDMKDDTLYAFFVKEGVYYLRDLTGENNSPTITRTASNKETRDIYTTKQWKIVVKAGALNYAGNIFIKDFSDNEKLNTKFKVKMENYVLSADISVRKRMADISSVLEKYPYLKDKQFPINMALFQEDDADNSTISDNYQQSKFDSQNKGYGSYYWGTPISEVKKSLELEGKKITVLSQDHLIDSTVLKNPVEFFFLPFEGDFALYKVQVYFLKSDFDSIFASLKGKYGDFAKKDEKSFTWYTTYTKLILDEKDESLILTYEAIHAKEETEQKNEVKDNLIK